MANSADVLAAWRPRFRPGTLERLARLDSCAVSDALDLSALSGAVLGIHAVCGARRIAGRAVTVQLGPADGRASKSHLCTAAVDASGPGDVIVVAHEGRLDVAGWGGLLSLGASIRKIEGVIVDGACRDVDESAALGLPVYARAKVPVTARGRVMEISWNTPVKIADVIVAPGDLVLADGSGVVFLGAQHAETIIAAAERITAKEAALAAAVRAGRPLAGVMDGGYERIAGKKA